MTPPRVCAAFASCGRHGSVVSAPCLFRYRDGRLNSERGPTHNFLFFVCVFHFFLLSGGIVYVRALDVCAPMQHIYSAHKPECSPTTTYDKVYFCLRLYRVGRLALVAMRVSRFCLLS